MRCASGANIIVCKIEKGEQVLPALEKAIKRYAVKSGTVLWAVGMIEKAEIGYFQGPNYKKDSYRERMEVVSFHGSITENEPRLHIHIALANSNHEVFGGHFFSGEANPLLEVQIQKLDLITMRREKNMQSGLKELYIP